MSDKPTKKQEETYQGYIGQLSEDMHELTPEGKAARYGEMYGVYLCKGMTVDQIDKIRIMLEITPEMLDDWKLY